MTITLARAAAAFGGVQGFYEHDSSAVALARCGSRVYLPPQAARRARAGALLPRRARPAPRRRSSIKAGAQRVAAELGLALVAPRHEPARRRAPRRRRELGLRRRAPASTSMRREAPWSRALPHALATSREELPALVEAQFPVDADAQSHLRPLDGRPRRAGARARASRALPRVSAFAPIVSPMRCRGARRRSRGYLGDDRAAWRAYDATALARGSRLDRPALLVDQGLNDTFLDAQLKPRAARGGVRGMPAIRSSLRRHAGYDHSYYFIATFIDDHLRYHATHLFDAPP